MSSTHMSLNRILSHLISGEAVSLVSGFLRNIIIARMVSPTDFGVAATLAMTISMIDMVTDFGVNRYLTRDLGEGRHTWLSSANWLAIARGIAGSAFLLLFAIPLATLLKMPDAAGAFALISIIPLIKSFSHNGIWLHQATHNYKSYVITQVGSQITTVILAYPLVKLIPNFYAMAWLSIINAVLILILSRYTCDIPYLVRYNREHTKELLRFGTPLLMDSALMFFVLHGERVLISNIFGPEMVGIFSAVLLLVWVPASVAGRLLLSMGIPSYSDSGKTTEDKKKIFSTLNRYVSLLALGTGVGFSIAGDAIVKLVYGNQYVVSITFCALIVANNMIRMIRSSLSPVSLAELMPSTQVIANSVKIVTLLIALLIARTNGSIVLVLAIGVVSEIISVIITLYYQRAILYVIRAEVILSLAVLLISISISALIGEIIFEYTLNASIRIGIATLAAIIIMCLYYFLSKAIEKQQ